MKLTITGRYNTYRAVYGKAYLSFTMTGTRKDIIDHLDALTRVQATFIINGSDPIAGKVNEILFVNDNTTMELMLDIDRSAIRDVAYHYFSSVVKIDIEYNDTDAVPIVNYAFYCKIDKLVSRMTKAMGLGNAVELREIVNTAYGKYIPITAHMTQCDAEELYQMLVSYAKENIPGIDVTDTYDDTSYLIARIKKQQCAVCPSTMVEVMDGIPLCSKHVKEYTKNPTIFKQSYHL